MDATQFAEEIKNKGDVKGNISHKVIEILTLKGETFRLGNISNAELRKLYRFNVLSKVYLGNLPRFQNGRNRGKRDFNELVEDYLNLSVSKKGLLLDKFENMYKSSEINTIIPDTKK